MTEGTHASPDWVDQNLTSGLPILRSRGEGQDLEYMEEFPKNTRELAKEIAAFATTNAGVILVGVADSGDLIGLSSCSTAEGRDQLIRRLEGISRGTVKPAVTPTAKFALEDGAVVLVVSVPKGSQPVYYCGGIPYVRHLTEARPAEPHEVVERIEEYLLRSAASLPKSDSGKLAEFYSALARGLVEVLLFADQIDDRLINPWLDIWRSEYGYVASQLRELAASEAALEEGVDGQLKKLADALDRVATFRLYLGAGDELKRLTADAAEFANELMDRHINPQELSEDSIRTTHELIGSSSRRLEDLASRAKEMVDSGRIEELQTEASEIGHDILMLSYYRIESLGEGIRDRLRDVGRSLHLTETMRLYLDGGASVNAVIAHVVDCQRKLSAIEQSLDYPTGGG